MYTAANGAWFSHALENFPTTYWNKEIQKRKSHLKFFSHYITRTHQGQNDHPLSNIFYFVLIGPFQKPPFTEVGSVSPFGLIQLASLSIYKLRFLQGFTSLFEKTLSDCPVLSCVVNVNTGKICCFWLIAGASKSPYNQISQLTIWPRGSIWAE